MIKLLRTHQNARYPQKSLPDDAGLDIYCVEGTILWPHQTKNISAGWNIKVPDNTWGSIKTRSSTFQKRKLLVLEGVIDPNYTGPLSVVIFNPTIFPKIIKIGERLAQLMIIPVEYRKIKEVYEMPKTTRGTSGFGHSGK